MVESWPRRRSLAGRKQFLADKLVVVGIAGKVGAITVGDGQRVSRWNIHLGDVVSQPIQVEARYNDAAHAAIVAVERQRELENVPGG